MFGAPGFDINEPSLQVVPKDSAVVDGREVEQIGIPATHVEMCKFSSTQDIGYRRILHQIRSCLLSISHSILLVEELR